MLQPLDYDAHVQCRATLIDLLNATDQPVERMRLLCDLADYANDCCGLAWPKVETLAAKVGVNLRNTHKLLKQVSTGPTGELEILLRAGPNKTNLYRFRGVSLETGCRHRHSVVQHQRGCPWRQGGGVASDRGRVSQETDNLSVNLSSDLSEPQGEAGSLTRGEEAKRPPERCHTRGCYEPTGVFSQNFCQGHALTYARDVYAQGPSAREYSRACDILRQAGELDA
jgi:hypothetical protein